MMTTLKFNKRAFIYSFFIALVYVSISTLSLLSAYPEDPLYGEWVTVVLLLTLPVSFIGGAITYACSDCQSQVLLVQVIVFFTFWFLLYLIMKKQIKATL